jgi:hypothetical protein
MAKTIGTAVLSVPASADGQTVRVSIYAEVNGKMGDEPLGWVELDDPETAGADVAALLRQIAGEL